jgi:hypothetical protein
MSDEKPPVQLNRRNAESVRQKIQISQLVNRLQKHGLGEVEMTSTQIDAAKFLINKRMPNLPERRELSGPDGGAIPMGMRITFVEP